MASKAKSDGARHQPRGRVNREEQARQQGRASREAQHLAGADHQQGGGGVPQQRGGVIEPRRAPQRRIERKRKRRQRAVKPGAGKALREQTRPRAGRRQGQAVLQVGVVQPHEPGEKSPQVGHHRSEPDQEQRPREQTPHGRHPNNGAGFRRALPGGIHQTVAVVSPACHSWGWAGVAS
jgi:hypothetical protein